MYISILPFDAEISIQLYFFMGRNFFHLVSSSLYLDRDIKSKIMLELGVGYFRLTF